MPVVKAILYGVLPLPIGLSNCVVHAGSVGIKQLALSGHSQLITVRNQTHSRTQAQAFCRFFSEPVILKGELTNFCHKCSSLFGHGFRSGSQRFVLFALGENLGRSLQELLLPVPHLIRAELVVGSNLAERLLFSNQLKHNPCLELCRKLSSFHRMSTLSPDCLLSQLCYTRFTNDPEIFVLIHGTIILEHDGRTGSGWLLGSDNPFRVRLQSDIR